MYARVISRSLINNFSLQVTPKLVQLCRCKEEEKAQTKEAVSQGLEVFDKELARRGTKFFGGNDIGKHSFTKMRNLTFHWICSSSFESYFRKLNFQVIWI